MYELFEHTADLGLRARAPSLEALLSEAGRGLLAMLVANPAAVRPVHGRFIELSAEEPDYLLFDWLSELLYAFEAEKLLLAEFDLQLTPNGSPLGGGNTPAKPGEALQRGPAAPLQETAPIQWPLTLRATCRGETIDPDRHIMEHEVKAITYHGLRVTQDEGGWEAEVIVDI